MMWDRQRIRRWWLPVAVVLAIGFLNRDHIFLICGTARASNGTAYTVYGSVNCRDLLIVGDKGCYRFDGSVIRLCNESQLHSFGPLMLQNPDDAGGVPLDGRHEKTNKLNAYPVIADGHLSFYGTEDFRSREQIVF